MNGGLERLDIGMVADYNFFANVHTGVLADTLADMQENINEVDDAYRASLGDTLTVRAPALVVFETEVDSDANLADCVTICIKDAGTSTEAIPNGNACSTNSDCADVGETCVTAPKRRGLCDTDSSNAGRFCLTNADCTGGGACDRGAALGLLRVCWQGPDDGNACQTSNAGCATYGNCCATDQTGGSCVQSWSRQVNEAGEYRANAGPSDPINTTNTGLIHLFSQCDAGLVGGLAAKIAGACESTRFAAALTNEGASSTSSSIGTTRHEMGHNIGAWHDDIKSHCGNMWISRNVCQGGTKKNQFCKDDSDCTGGGTCTKPNRRFCKGAVTPDPKVYCDDFDLASACDPPNNTCIGGPAFRLCVGGADDGERCNSKQSSPCASPGTCTGPPLNWNLYYMGGGGYDFSPCSKTDIAVWEANPPTQCLLGLDCGDLNRSGTITATDANLALQISIGSLPFDPLGDVVPFDNPDLTVTASDASYILNVAVGSATAPTVCGE